MIEIIFIAWLIIGSTTFVSGRAVNRNDFLDITDNDQIHLGPPVALTVTSMGDDKSFAKVEVTWEPPIGFEDATGETAMKEYILYYVQASGSNWKALTIPGSLNSVAITGLRQNTEYSFRIRGNTNSMDGPLSDSVFFATGNTEGSAFDEETEDAFDNEDGDLY